MHKPSPASHKSYDPLHGQEEDRQEGKATKKTPNIDGMMCNHCQMRVESALGGLAGVGNVEVSLEEGRAIVSLELDVPDRYSNGLPKRSATRWWT